MSAEAHLLVMVLRVLPGEIREWLNAERSLPGKTKEELDTYDSVRNDQGFG